MAYSRPSTVNRTRNPQAIRPTLSANYSMAPVMIQTLRDAGWPATIVTPYSQLEYGWIQQEWRYEVEHLLAIGRIRGASPP